MGKVSTFLISIVLIGLFAGVFTTYYGSMAGLNANATFDNSSLEAYQQSEKLNRNLSIVREQLEDVTGNNDDTGVGSFAVAFITSGWRVLKTTFASFEIFTTMSNQAAEDVSGYSNVASYIVIAIGSIAFIYFAFIFISALVGRDL